MADLLAIEENLDRLRECASFFTEEAKVIEEKVKECKEKADENYADILTYFKDICQKSLNKLTSIKEKLQLNPPVEVKHEIKPDPHPPQQRIRVVSLEKLIDPSIKLNLSTMGNENAITSAQNDRVIVIDESDEDNAPEVNNLQPSTVSRPETCSKGLPNGHLDSPSCTTKSSNAVRSITFDNLNGRNSVRNRTNNNIPLRDLIINIKRSKVIEDLYKRGGTKLNVRTTKCDFNVPDSEESSDNRGKDRGRNRRRYRLESSSSDEEFSNIRNSQRRQRQRKKVTYKADSSTDQSSSEESGGESISSSDSEFSRSKKSTSSKNKGKSKVKKSRGTPSSKKRNSRKKSKEGGVAQNGKASSKDSSDGTEAEDSDISSKKRVARESEKYSEKHQRNSSKDKVNSEEINEELDKQPEEEKTMEKESKEEKCKSKIKESSKLENKSDTNLKAPGESGTDTEKKDKNEKNRDSETETYKKKKKKKKEKLRDESVDQERSKTRENTTSSSESGFEYTSQRLDQEPSNGNEQEKTSKSKSKNESQDSIEKSTKKTATSTGALNKANKDQAKDNEDSSKKVEDVGCDVNDVSDDNDSEEKKKNSKEKETTENSKHSGDENSRNEKNESLELSAGDGENDVEFLDENDTNTQSDIEQEKDTVEKNGEKGQIESEEEKTVQEATEKEKLKKRKDTDGGSVSGNSNVEDRKKQKSQKPVSSECHSSNSTSDEKNSKNARNKKFTARAVSRCKNKNPKVKSDSESENNQYAVDAKESEKSSDNDSNEKKRKAGKQNKSLAASSYIKDNEEVSKASEKESGKNNERKNGNSDSDSDDEQESNSRKSVQKTKGKLKLTIRRFESGDDDASDKDDGSENEKYGNKKIKPISKRKAGKNNTESETTEKSDDDFVESPKNKSANKRKRRQALSDVDSDESLIKRKSSKKKKSESKNRNDSDDDDVEEADRSKKPSKRKRIKPASSGSGSSGSDKDNNKKRKNIRKLIKKKDLNKDTKTATKEEEERKRRIEERQKLYNEIYEKAENIELNKLVLDFDEETKEELLKVDEGLLKQLKPHQATGVKFMWDACFETLKDVKSKPGSGCILAHCMGLGKTLQVITLTHTLITNKDKTSIERVLIITPLSTLSNWKREFHHWFKYCKNKDIEVYDMSLWRENNARVHKLNEWHEDGGVCIIGYDMYRILANPTTSRIRKKLRDSLYRSLVDPGPDLVVCDEGHLLKNEKTSLSKAVSNMKTQRRIVLTGTPLQNNLKEYYCMIQFVKPNLLGTFKEYMNRFVNPINNGQYADSTERDIRLMKNRSHVLHKLLEGCIQRRDYSVLAPYLPPKHEYVIFIKLTEIQVKLYSNYMQTQKPALSEIASKGAVLFQDFQNLRRIWTHPLTLKINSEQIMKRKVAKGGLSDSEGSLKDFIDDGSESSASDSSESSDVVSLSDSNGSVKSNKAKGSGQRSTNNVRRTRQNADTFNEDDADVLIVNEQDKEWWQSICPEEDLYNISHSNKLLLLMHILEESEAIGDKVLLFSQSLQSLDVIEHFLSLIDEKTNGGEIEGDVGNIRGSWAAGTDYFRLDGSCSVESREHMCKVFNDESNLNARLFLISTRAGGLGINLVAANRVIIFDVSWNPSHDTQSIFRVYRFGQKKPCYIYRFIAMGTMEEKIYERQVAKQATAKRVIDEQQIGRQYSQNDLLELYKYDLEPTDPRPVPALPKDRLFADLLVKHENSIYKYHEHDSLLENEESEILNEEERKAAWLEYEAEKNKPAQGMAYARQQYGPVNGPVTSNKIFGFRTDVLLRLLNMKLQRDHPLFTDAQIVAMVPVLLQQLYAQMNAGELTLYNQLMELSANLEIPQGYYINPMAMGYVTGTGPHIAPQYSNLNMQDSMAQGTNRQPPQQSPSEFYQID